MKMETGFSDVHPDIIQSHVLARLGGCELASVSCVSRELRSLSTGPDLWYRICKDTWPSTNTPRLRQVISSFPGGPLSFFSLAFPSMLSSSPRIHMHAPPAADADVSSTTSILISAVDVFYKNQPVLSKTQETETSSGWFRSAPFRIDLLDAKEEVPTPIPSPGLLDTCSDLALSWIVIDPMGRRAVNISSMRPVSVHRHWLTGEVQTKFATVMENDVDGQEVLCAVEVTWAAVEEGRGLTVVREVGLEVEDVDGIRLKGMESVRILQRALDCVGRRPVVPQPQLHEQDDVMRKSKYEEFMQRRRDGSERRKRDQQFWDQVYVTTTLLLCAALFVFTFWPNPNPTYLMLNLNTAHFS